MERDFKGVWIPKEIWLNEELSLLEKCLFTEIDSLDNNEGCYASNEYFAKFCNCSESAISKALSKLNKLGLVEVVSFNGRQRILQGRVVKFTRQSSKIYEAESENKHNKMNNTSNNIIYNRETRFSKPTLEEVQEYCAERKNNINAQQFIDFYTSKGWKIGKEPMKDWKACVRTWENRERKASQPKEDVLAKRDRMLRMLENETEGV